IVDTRRASDVVGGWPDRIDFAGKNKLLDFFLNLIIQLVTVVPEKFDAIILIGIMRSGQDNTGVCAQRSRDVSHTGCRQRSDDKDVDSRGRDPGSLRVYA